MRGSGEDQKANNADFGTAWFDLAKKKKEEKVRCLGGDGVLVSRWTDAVGETATTLAEEDGDGCVFPCGTVCRNAVILHSTG